MKSLIVLFLFLSSSLVCAKFEYGEDWKVHKFCGKDSRLKQDYCLEMIELENADINSTPALLIPGFFQNAHIYDLLPKKNISVARYLREKWNIHPFILHVRGIGNSDYLKKSDMDDVAIDDINMAVNHLHDMLNKKPLLIGHSQGAITAQAYLAGLSHCILAPCFDPVSAFKRQRKVKRAGLLAGNVSMSFDNPKNWLGKIAGVGVKLKRFLALFDEIDVKQAVRFTGPVAYLGFWEFLYELENVGPAARKALYQKSADSTSSGIVLQFAKGVEAKNIKTKSFISYSSGLKLVRLPVYQQVFSEDPLAEPEATFRDSFSKIESKNKKFEVVKKRGHEDFFMSESLHPDLDSMMRFLTQ